MYSLEPHLPESTIMEETKRIRKSTGPDQQLDFYQQQFINTSVHVHGSPSSSLRSMAVLSSCRGSLCPRPPLLLSAPNQNRHATQATPVRLRHIPQTGRHNYDYLTLSLLSVLGFRPFFAKILAHFSAVSKLNNILEICQKMRNIQEICSRKWLRNRKSKVAEYSKILADRPSEITRWLPLYQYYKAFLQSFYRRLSGRKQPVGGDSSKRQFYQLLCMILDEKPTIPIILDCEQSLRMVTRARKSSEAIESKKQEAEGNHFVLLRLVCPPYNLIAL